MCVALLKLYAEFLMGIEKGEEPIVLDSQRCLTLKGIKITDLGLC